MFACSAYVNCSIVLIIFRNRVIVACFILLFTVLSNLLFPLSKHLLHSVMESMTNTENGVEEATGSSDEDLDWCDQDSVASSVDTTAEEMFMAGLDPILDLPSKEVDSPEEDWDSEAGLQPRKRSRLSSTSTSPKGDDMKNGKESRSSPDVSSTERWHSSDEADVEPNPLLFTPVQTPGPTSVPTTCSSPLQFFQLLLSKLVMQTIVGHTNVYGTKCMEKIRKQWYYISLQDFKSFIALIIYMGLVRCSSLKDYWRESQNFRVSFPAQIMSYQNFLKISNAFHLSNTTEDEKNDKKKGTSSYQRLGKIQSLYQEIRDACRKYFHPFQNITIDERIVASQARTGLEECKSTNNGYKLFALSDCTCGYTWDFFIYEGKSCASQSEGLGYESIMALVDENFLGTGYKLFVDQFYTSPTLFRDLLHKKTLACGPVHANRKGFPRTAVNRLPRNSPRGNMRWIRDKELLFVWWKDAQEVQMCSTFHKAFGGDTVQRKVKDNDGHRTLVDIPIPAAVLDYKRTLREVNPSNHITGHYRALHKPKKWYHSMFYHFLDIVVENAFILQELMAKAKNKKVLTRKAFLETLIVELTEIGSLPRNDSAPVRSVPAPSTTPSPASSSTTTDTSLLFHKPKHIAQDSTDGRRRCRHCHQKTPIICVTCNVPLCFQPKRDCFNEWHDKLVF